MSLHGMCMHPRSGGGVVRDDTCGCAGQVRGRVVAVTRCEGVCGRQCRAETRTKAERIANGNARAMAVGRVCAGSVYTWEESLNM